MDAVTEALHNEYEKAKENLKGVDEKFIRLYGREPVEKRQQRRVSRPGGGGTAGPAGRLFGEASRIINNPNREQLGGPVGMERGGGRPVRRVSLGQGSRLGNIQSRLGPKRRREDSGDEDDMSPNKPVMQSAVIKPELKREDSVAMRTDKKGMARNRRMFGALLGTLQSFQKDSKKEEGREKRRAEVEKRLEEKQQDEKIQLRQARAALWEERREKQKELRLLEAKMRLVKAFEEWETTIRHQANFIKTTGRSRHHIFYKPKSLLPANKKALQVTEEYVEGVVKDQKRRLEAEIERMMNSSQRPRDRRGRRDAQSPDRRRRDSDRGAGDTNKSKRRDKTEKEDGEKSDSDESEDHSESEDQATDSEAEEGELADSRKRVREQNNAEAMAGMEVEEPAVTVKTEKEDGEEVQVKKEDVDAAAEVDDSAASQKVSNGSAEVGDEVEDAAPNQPEQSEQPEADPTAQVEKVDEASEGTDKEQKLNPKQVRQRRSRSGSSSSRSRSPSRSKERRKRRTPPKRKPKQSKAPADKSRSGSSSSGSGSGSGSGSDSGSGSRSSPGSDSEPDKKKPKSADK